MSGFEDEPALGEGRQIHLHVDQPSVKFVRNAKGDTQIEVKTTAGCTQAQMDELRRIAYTTYRSAVESIGGALPEVQL